MEGRILKAVLIVCLGFPLVCRAALFDGWLGDFEKWVLEEASENSGSGGVEIKNEIRVEANTGGNKAEGGQVIEGEARVEVHIKNVIDGQEVEPIDIEQAGGEVKVESRIEARNGQAQVERNIEINSQKETKEDELKLNGPPAESFLNENQETEAGESLEEELLEQNLGGEETSGGRELEENLLPAAKEFSEPLKLRVEAVRRWWSGWSNNFKSWWQNILTIF